MVEQNVNIDTCDGGSEVRKRVCGVSRAKNKWRARIQHPKLKIEISLGSYYSHEEAALAVMKKKAEFLEMFKGDNFERRQLPPGVRRRGYSRWGAIVYDPKLKRETSLSCYDTPEEAATALANRRNEFLKMYGWRPYFKRGCNTDDNLSKEPRITGLEPKSRISLGTFDNVEDDVRSFNNGKAELGAIRENANKGPINPCPTSVLGSDYLNNVSITDKSNGVGVHAPDKLEHEFFHRSPILIFEPGNSDRGCVSEFDEAVSLGFINEYGQLMGMYSDLDKQMEFSVPDEDVLDTGCY